MRVLLIKDVKGLGKAGEVKEVKDGYGNNFLVGKGYAKVATDAVMRQREASKRAKAESDAYEVAQAKSLADDLAKIKLEISVKIGANGALFGSVTKDEIAKALKDKGFEIDKKCLEFDSIKTPGEYEIHAKLGHQITAKFTLSVKGE